MYKNLVIFIAAFCLLLGVPPVSQAGPPAQEPTNMVSTTQKLTTPQLIEAALDRGDIDQDTANLYLAYALGNYDSLPSEYHSDVPWHGTLSILNLQEATKTMKLSPKRTEIIEILSGSCGSSTGTLSNTLNSTHFHIQYGTISGGLTITNYSNSLETTWTKEITTFGWAAPPVLASNPPPGNRYHVRIDNLGGGLYGYVTTSGAHAGFVGNNPNTSWNDVDAYASCMVLNRDYSPFPGTSQQALDATTAHEFNHSIQAGYGVLTGSNRPDANFIEGGATWMEDEVFDSANDNYNYLWPSFSTCMGEYTPSPYPYWITWRGLTERYGTGIAGGGEQVMQDFWETASKSSTNNMLNNLNTALGNRSTNLANAYHAYAIAVKFNKTCGGGFSYPYCFQEASGYVAAAGSNPSNGSITTPGNTYNGSIADNYALNWVNLPSTGTYPVTLQNTSGGGQLRGSVVCNTGSTLTVKPLPAVVGSGGSTTLNNFNAAGCSSVVAVITNQAQTAGNPTSCTARSYKLKTELGGSTPSALTYVPLILKPKPSSSCTPGSGDSDNINDALNICSGKKASGKVSGSDIDDVYKIWISGTQQLTISMNGTGGDADLFLYPPGTTNVITDPFVDVSAHDGNNEFIQGVASNNGSGKYWYIDVYSFLGTTNYNVTATLSSPKTGTKTFTFSGTAQPRGSSLHETSP
ncbi:MAG: PPC domain-containing protein [Anaerolineae bacterium]|nr:PPC domain-containing protein [Anaerolineae bacterium]